MPALRRLWLGQDTAAGHLLAVTVTAAELHAAGLAAPSSGWAHPAGRWMAKRWLAADHARLLYVLLSIVTGVLSAALGAAASELRSLQDGEAQCQSSLITVAAIQCANELTVARLMPHDAPTS